MSLKTKTMMELSFMYALGFAILWVVYRVGTSFIASTVLAMLLADVAMTLFIWIYGLIRRNSSVYDPYWSIVPPVILMIWMIDANVLFTAPSVWLFLGVTVWSLRLTHNWALGWTDFSEEDWRYVMIREKHPRIWPLSNLFGIMLMPTFIVFIQLIGSHQVISAEAEGNLWTTLGGLMIVAAAGIQYVADQQMRRFRFTHRGSKQCIEEGLWKWSRHPNYFGEVTVWWGVYVLYVGVFGTLDLMILPPILMTALFLFISIPMMEKKILLTRPEYADYQERVSMIVPFPPKKPISKESVVED